jgi:hypothetical protein
MVLIMIASSCAISPYDSDSDSDSWILGHGQFAWPSLTASAAAITVKLDLCPGQCPLLDLTLTRQCAARASALSLPVSNPAAACSGQLA